MFTFCVLNLIFSLVETLGNFVVILALCKVSSIPANLKKLFLSLAVSDFAVGLFAQLMFGIIIAVMLKMAENGNFNFDFLCPRCNGVTVYSPIYVNNKYVIYSCMQAYYIYVRVGPSRHGPEEELTL